MYKVKEFSVESHIDHAQYFPGAGVAFTRYTDCIVGVGETFAEAMEDALEYIAQRGVVDVHNLAKRIKKENGWKKWPSDQNAHEDCEDLEEDSHEGCEFQYYVGISWN